MLYVLFGEDNYSIHQSLEEIKRGAGDPAMLAVNTTLLDGQQASPEQLRAVCEAAPFLTEKRLVVVNGLLERFEPQRKSSRQKKTKTPANHQEKLKSLVECIKNTPDSTVLVLIDGKTSANNPLLKELSDKAEVRSFPLLRGDKLSQWIQRRVREEGGSISPQAIGLLGRLVGGDLWVMANEINKLVLFTSGRRIEEEDIKAIASHAQQANVFAMVDAILEFKAGLAEQSLQQLLQMGDAPVQLLFMLSRQVEMIVRAKELKNQGKSGLEIRNRLGIAEFALHKTLEQAGRHPWEQLQKIYHKLLEADLSIKTGKYDGELALNILIAELCQQRH